MDPHERLGPNQSAKIKAECLTTAQSTAKMQVRSGSKSLSVVERYLDELLNELPENKVSVFARCDRHINKIDFDEALDNSQAEVLSKEYEKALKGTKWQYAPHFHKFRHTLASQMIEDGKTKEEVQAYVGWADDAMVERYSHANHELKVKTIRETLSYIQF